ncbi:hypothetical protein ACEQ6C_38910, partial [Rhizobium ruizarguesonis]
FFHVHGKYATIRWEVIKEHGIFGKENFVFMRTPGFGDSNWTDIISELRLSGWSGSIDDEFAAPGMLEVVQRIELTSHLKRVAIDRVMPAFDVDRA